jgi:hypothetical protein
LRDIIKYPSDPIVLPASCLTSTVKKIAQTSYDERKFIDLPALAGALEEAGCSDAELLAHCRGPGPHVRGCWALDLILGKS